MKGFTVAMHELQHLMSSLIDQGQSIYPYSPHAVGLAASGSFGTLHAPVFAALQPAAFSHLQMEAILEAPAGASLAAEAMFQQHRGRNREPVDRRVGVELRSLDARTAMANESPVDFASDGGEHLKGTLRLSALHLGGRFWRVQALLRNETPLARGIGVIGKTEATAHAFLTAHVLLLASGGRFHSPLAREGRIGALVLACRNENTVPVIASPDDEILLGAALAPRERSHRTLANRFDRAELDEAKILH